MRFERSEIEGTIGARFDRVAAAHRDRVAILERDHAWTYAEVLARSDLYRDRLAGRRDDTPVACVFDHSAEAVFAMIGTIRAGLPIVPVDAAAPPEGLGAILRDCQLVFADAKGADLCRAQPCVTEIVTEPAPQSAPIAPPLLPSPQETCVIFLSSGTSGVAKGALRSHRNLLNHVWQLPNRHDYSPSDRQAHISAFSFGGSVPVIFGALLTGGSLDVLHIRNSGASEFAATMQARGITLLQLTPSLMREVVSILAAAPSDWQPRRIVVGGEPLHWQDIADVRDKLGWRCPIVHRLASTEAGIIAEWTIDTVEGAAEAPVPVGWPADSREIAILDDMGQPLPQGHTGEIRITGDYLSSGYWNKPGLTTEKFTPAPTDTVTLRQHFYSGDLGRVDADGKLQFLGRKDGMVKIRGMRVELPAVEAALRRTGQVTNAFATTATRGNGRTCLVAYVQPELGATVTEPELRHALLADLPEFMVPRRIVLLDVLPLTAGGKVNRRAVPPPSTDRPDGLGAMTPPETAAQTSLTQLICTLLEVEAIGIDDDLFDLGADSIDVMNIALRIEQKFDTTIDDAAYYTASTVRHLAALLPDGAG